MNKWNEENLKLLREYRRGNEALLEELILKNMGLVVMVTTKMLSVAKIYSFEEADIKQEGIIGLINAINSYDFTKNYAFSSYAYKAIKNNIINALCENANIVKVPCNVAAKLRELYNKKDYLALWGERVSVLDLVRQEEGLDFQTYRRALLFWGEMLSLEDVFRTFDDKVLMYGEIIASDDDVVEEVFRRDDKEAVKMLLDILTERQREAVSYTHLRAHET